MFLADVSEGVFFNHFFVLKQFGFVSEGVVVCFFFFKNVHSTQIMLRNSVLWKIHVTT